MARVTTRPVFDASLLPEGRTRWDLFGASFGVECIALAILIIVPMLMPEKLEAVKHYWITPVAAPPVTAWKPQPKPVPVKREVVKELPKPVEAEVIAPPKPKIYNPVMTAPVAKPATTRKKVSGPDLAEVAKAFPDPNPPMSMGSSAIPTLKKPREEVQTGGFGDPNGLPAATGKITRGVNVNALGSYDLPPGPGYGNGTGGAKGAKGVIASTGFGNGVATGSPGGGSHQAVKQDVFASEQPVAATTKPKQEAPVSNSKPAEITYKPRPAYTNDARAARIEGEVLLEVVFTASGEVRVERVVKGLGHGLDESAEAAARQIQFRPAQRNGQPVDSDAIVHITFELAY